MKSFRKACRGQKGFTLIELLVVIIILGVLAAVVTLAVTRFIGKGNLESANAELVTVQAAIESAFADANASEFDDASYAWTGDLGYESDDYFVGQHHGHSLRDDADAQVQGHLYRKAGRRGHECRSFWRFSSEWLGSHQDRMDYPERCWRRVGKVYPIV